MREQDGRAVLAIDTSGGLVSLALVRRGSAYARRSSSARAGDVLHGLIDELLAEAGLPVESLGLLAVARGPGSFTGLRVGLAAASGLALAAGVPAVGIETTRAVALASGRKGAVGVVLEGGQGRVFAALHDVAGTAAPRMGPVDVAPRDAVELLRDADVRILRGRAPEAEELVEAGFVAFDDPIAEAVARLALDEPPDPATLQALYAREPTIRPSAPLAGAASSRPHHPPHERAERGDSPPWSGPVPAALEEAEALADVLAQTMRDAWSVDVVRQVLKQGGIGLLARDGAGRPIGAALLRVIADEAEILQVAVAGPSRRRGLGRALVASCLFEAVRRGARAAYLEVRESNEAARRLYSAAGFEEIGRRRRYYADGEDASVMRRDLALPPPPG